MFFSMACSKLLFECQTRSVHLFYADSNPADLIDCGKLLVAKFTTQVVRILRSSMTSVDRNRNIVYTDSNGSWQGRQNIT